MFDIAKTKLWKPTKISQNLQDDKESYILNFDWTLYNSKELKNIKILCERFKQIKYWHFLYNHMYTQSLV